MYIEDLRELLQNEVVTVTFRKKDGNLREMLCTTRPDILEKYFGPYSQSSTSVISEEVITVCDLEVEQWRSFRFDSVISVYTDGFEYVAGS